LPAIAVCLRHIHWLTRRIAGKRAPTRQTVLVNPLP
jgi:hypothetical protein